MEDDDDVSDVPLVASRENSRSPVRRYNVGTRSSSRATIERLRSVLAYVSSSSGQTGISGMITSGSDGCSTDPEEATTSMMAHQSAPMSASPSTRHVAEDVDRLTTLPSPSVVRAPHSVASSAITYSHPDPILTAPASRHSQFPSRNEASRRADDRSYSPVFASISENVALRRTWEEEGYRALCSHQLRTPCAAATDGCSALHPMYCQDHAGANDKFLDRDFLVSPCMMKLLEYPTLCMLKSDGTLRSADDLLIVGVARGCVIPADRRPCGRVPTFMNTAKVAPRHVSMNHISLPRKLEGLVERTLSEDYRYAHYRSPVYASRSLASARGPHHPPGGVIPSYLRRVDAARCLLAQRLQDGTNSIMTIPVSALHSLYLDIEHRCVHTDPCPLPVGGVLDMVPHALHLMSVRKCVHPDALSRAYARDLPRLKRIRTARSSHYAAHVGSVDDGHYESSDSDASAQGSQCEDGTDLLNGLCLSLRGQLTTTRPPLPRLHWPSPPRSKLLFLVPLLPCSPRLLPPTVDGSSSRLLPPTVAGSSSRLPPPTTDLSSPRLPPPTMDGSSPRRLPPTMADSSPRLPPPTTDASFPRLLPPTMAGFSSRPPTTDGSSPRLPPPTSDGSSPRLMLPRPPRPPTMDGSSSRMPQPTTDGSSHRGRLPPTLDGVDSWSLLNGACRRMPRTGSRDFLVSAVRGELPSALLLCFLIH